jgi:gliding motility-associated protein GldM
MAGGKETPRQKMIGMMYLVLTALLALNVSKQILDAFVAIELNIQKGTITQLDRGNLAITELNQESTKAKADKQEGLAKLAKINYFLKKISEVDKETGYMIRDIDKLKMLILSKVGEDTSLINVSPTSAEAKDFIVWKRWSKKNPLVPAKLNLAAVESKDNFDVPDFQLIGDNPENIPANAKGMILWNNLKKYRNKLVDLTGTYNYGGKQYVVKSEDIKAYRDFADCEAQITTMLKKNKKMNKSDIGALMSIYQELTKEEFNILTKGDKANDVKREHWLARTFAHAPLVGALATLSSLQNEIISARAKAVIMLKGKISTGQYTFNEIKGMAHPETAVLSAGDEFEVSVFVSAFDTDKQPVVKPSQGTISKIENGIATLKLRASGTGEMKISGQVGIADKDNTIKWMDYSTAVQVASKGGSLEMPEFALLYRGYPNKIIASASGLTSPTISAPGCVVRPITYNGRSGYSVTPSSGSSVNITLSAKDAKGKTVTLGTYPYKIKTMPPPTASVSSISKSGGRVTVAIEGSNLVAKYNYIKILVGEDYSGPGNIVPASALSKFRVGKKVGVMVVVTSSLTGGLEYRVPAYLTVTQ